MISLNIPTILTAIRLILSPLLLPFLFVHFLPLHNIYINILLGCVFSLISLTDFLDGYLARKYKQVTSLGSMLDPIADKFLIYSTLISLLAVHKIHFFWVIILIGREFFIMGLRILALENGFSIKVSKMGKLKTTFQIICFIFIIINPYEQTGLHFTYQGAWNWSELLLIFLTVYYSLISAFSYYEVFIKQYSVLQSRNGE